jgi:hypothetical protein
MAKHQHDWNTPDLFGNSFGSPVKTHVRRKDPITSKLAAKSIDSKTLEMRVYDVICKFPYGCISDDVVRMIPEHGVQTISPRFAKLIKKGFIEDTGKQRQGAAGRMQRIMRRKVD